MDLFKKLAVVRRNNRSGSIVSDDEVDNAVFCHQDSEDVIAEVSNDSIDDSSSSLYGRRRSTGSPVDTCPPEMAVVTSSKFDSEEVFSVVARAMLNRYQHDGMSEREVILGTLDNIDDMRAFIEALDLKYIVLTSQNTNGTEDSGDETLSEIVFKTRSIFDATLKTIWREKDSSSSTLRMVGGEEDFRQHRGEMIACHDEYKKRHPKTPKNLRMSPMRTSSYNYRNHGIISQSESMDSACSEGSNNSMFRPFKRPRRWFFPQNKTERLVTPPFSSPASKIALEANKVFPAKVVLPKFHFNFGNNSHTSKKNSMIFGDLGRGPKSVTSSHIDGTFTSYESKGDENGLASIYMPPTSPIRKVSTELKANCYTGAAMS